MAQTLLYRWFGLGGLARHTRADLESDGIVFVEEGIWFTIKFEHFKAPGVRITWRKKLTAGSIVLTRKRFAAYSGLSLLTIAEFPIGDPPSEDLRIEVCGNSVHIQFEAANFLPNQSGQITMEFTSSNAAAIYDALHPAA